MLTNLSSEQEETQETFLTHVGLPTWACPSNLPGTGTFHLETRNVYIGLEQSGRRRGKGLMESIVVSREEMKDLDSWVLSQGEETMATWLRANREQGKKENLAGGLDMPVQRTARREF